MSERAQIVEKPKPPRPSTPLASGATVFLQRKCACGGTTAASGGECEECKKKKLQRRAASAGGPMNAPPIVHQVLNSPGRPLDASTRSFMEPRFGHSFGNVRIHADEQAAQSARSVNALAYTVGNSIVFDTARCPTSSNAWKKTLVHELTHVVQQDVKSSPVPSCPAAITISDPGDAAEQQAERAVTAIFGHHPLNESPISPAASLSRDTPKDGGYSPYGTKYTPYQPEPESKCDTLCKSLSSMANSVDHLCKLAGESDSRCKDDRAKLADNTKKIADFGCKCQPDVVTELKKANVVKGSAWDLCSRKSSKRVSGFKGDTSGTHINAIIVDIKPSTYSSVTLSWANSSLSPDIKSLPTTFNSSPGAGLCSTDCSDTTSSNKSGSHCTGVGSFVVQGYSCHLKKYPAAKFVTWFDYDREIAFHYFNVPAYPASHGCVRMDPDSRGAEWIFDNTLPSITTVKVNRNAADGPGPRCWSGESLVGRPSDKKKTKSEK